MRCFTPKIPVLAIPLSSVLTCSLQLHCNNIFRIVKITTVKDTK